MLFSLQTSFHLYLWDVLEHHLVYHWIANIPQAPLMRFIEREGDVQCTQTPEKRYQVSKKCIYWTFEQLSLSPQLNLLCSLFHHDPKSPLMWCIDNSVSDAEGGKCVRNVATSLSFYSSQLQIFLSSDFDAPFLSWVLSHTPIWPVSLSFFPVLIPVLFNTCSLKSKSTSTLWHLNIPNVRDLLYPMYSTAALTIPLSDF